MMQLHLFGARTPSGEALRQQLCATHPALPLVAYSRSDPSLSHADFSDPGTFRFGGDPGVPGLLVSFGPIWLLAPFLEQLAIEHPEILQSLRGLIVCSSSSAITKRFATNHFDRLLVSRLITAEEKILSICRQLDLSCRIIRPTLIYGSVNSFVDQNLSYLIALMRRLPLLPLPADTGLRQPIHAIQLAAVVLEWVHQFTTTGWDPQLSQRIALGGDCELSYAAMLRALQRTLPQTDSARRCRFLFVPNRLFYSAAAPLILYSPKAFEAVLRMGSDLSGFTPVHQLLKSNPQPFPLLPLL